MTPGGKALAEFVAEATEILDALGRDLLALDEAREQEADPEHINGIFRAAHSLKGLSGLFGQERITQLAHAAEDLLDRLRLGRLTLDNQVLDTLVDALDTFQALLGEASRSEEGAELTQRTRDMEDRFARLGSPPPAVEEDPLERLELDAAVRAVFTEYEEHRLRENVRRGVALWRVRAAFDLTDFDQGLADLNTRLKPLGEVISTLPSSRPGGVNGIAFDLIFGAKVAAPALEAGLQGTPAELAPLAVRPPQQGHTGAVFDVPAPPPPEAVEAEARPPKRGGKKKGGRAKAPAPGATPEAPSAPVDSRTAWAPGTASSPSPGAVRAGAPMVSGPSNEVASGAPSARPVSTGLSLSRRSEGPGVSRSPGLTDTGSSRPPPQLETGDLEAEDGAGAPSALAPVSGGNPPRMRAVGPPPTVVGLQAAASAPLPATGRPRTEETSLRSLTQTVRVDIGRLDGLINMVGELLLIKANLQRLAETSRQDGTVALSKLFGQELSRETRQLERKLEALQEGLLEARMVPVGQVFDKLARLVRKIAREAGKEIDFVSAGGEVELDKLIVEELSDPLMHLIRNAIDHGAEGPEARLGAGKPRRAVVRLRAEQKGNHVVISVSDDGSGIDEVRVREVALSRGLVTPSQVSEMTRRELLNLIFLPGFSTRSSVSALSGRGVGLDVVKNNLGNLSGIIDVWSERGRGTAFHLTLPVTLAIVRALVVGVSGRTYAVPLNSVLEILSVQPRDIRTVERREVLDLRGQTLPFLRLGRLFHLPEREVNRHFVVVVGLAQQRLGIAVDELFGQQDIVTKPLGGRLSNVKGVSGATDLGNRRTVLVLDVAELLEEGIAQERRRA
ncbi:chemotaxis protein CheA [Corallococcus sp. Z5C101001]|uniref:chemotaxis protein CheA n=1 Tax=Corallococcus sp. Z5C101001 TaxID=2596829 RepID=UPI0011812DAF|nr:chemotaxis protein CheA [Corallococcus sp. Z5C101001]TSC22736.1 chemotaxis protein CheA [Corallococcus sp. Z5C101001]